MGEIKPKGKVILVTGFLFSDLKVHDELLRELEGLWGPVGRRSDVLPFDFTSYYEDEMGPHLKRQFIAFADLFEAEGLRGTKIASNVMEENLSIEGRRRVNIDPGFLDLSKIVVASTKDATYRVYLGEGIYAQSMLRFEKGSYRPWPWTYPDYRSEAAISFFNSVRADYRAGSIKKGTANRAETDSSFRLTFNMSAGSICPLIDLA